MLSVQSLYGSGLMLASFFTIFSFLADLRGVGARGGGGLQAQGFVQVPNISIESDELSRCACDYLLLIGAQVTIFLGGHLSQGFCDRASTRQ
jgi:hypothetical protein